MIKIRGSIFNIQRFSLHDGPGIRTTVFFKGCPLHCAWCQNPEGIGRKSQLIRHWQKCIGCYSCLEHCPQGALTKGPEGPQVDFKLCYSCFLCSEICPANAFAKAGETITAEELVTELLKDRLVFEESGGGVTFSGGEPLMQPAFLLEVLQLLKNERIHSAVETCGYSSWKILLQAAALTDLFLYDLKLIDQQQYLKYTGVPGKLILLNLKKLLQLNVAVKVRMPLIKGINDDPGSLQKAAAYLLDVGVNRVELIPYHNYGEAKYEKIGQSYQLAGMAKYSDNDIKKVRATLSRAGINTNSEGELDDHSRTGFHGTG